MRILEIEKNFKSEETLDKVLEAVEKDIELVDYWADTRKTGVVQGNSEEIVKALNDLSGAYSNLHTVLALAETEKRNREDRKYGELRIQAENNSQKFVSASAEREASESVGSYRRIRNIIKNYVEAAALNINTLQSELKKLTIERQRHPSTDNE